MASSTPATRPPASPPVPAAATRQDDGAVETSRDTVSPLVRSGRLIAASDWTLLTRSGVGAAVVGVGLIIVGLSLRYEELLVLGIIAVLLVGFGLWVAQRPLQAGVERRLTTVRVQRGDPIRATYRVRNDRRFSTPRAVVIDECDTIRQRTVLPPVPGRSVVDIPTSIDTRRRGIHQLDHLTIERVDPFWMAVGRRRREAYGIVTVHPRIYELTGTSGLAQAVENEAARRLSSTDPLSGFVSMREYVQGDDPRLIHWPTTARVGEMMVREHFEVRRPEFTIVLDSAGSVASADDFEEMADVAASIAVHSIRTGYGVIVRTTSRQHAGTLPALSSEADVVDFLTPVKQTAGSDLLTISSLFVTIADGTSVLTITGPSGPSSSLPISDRYAVVRVGRGAADSDGVMIAAEDAADFARRWRLLP